MDQLLDKFSHGFQIERPMLSDTRWRWGLRENEGSVIITAGIHSSEKDELPDQLTAGKVQAEPGTKRLGISKRDFIRLTHIVKKG